jgi:hypothetical protein
VGRSSIARESFGVTLWLRCINLGLEKGVKELSHRSWQRRRRHVARRILSLLAEGSLWAQHKGASGQYESWQQREDIRVA